MKENSKPLRIKIISMGNPGVGKSCLIKRYCEKRFVDKYLATIGIDYGVTKIGFRNKELKINIFDMAGHSFFYEVRNEFYKETQGAILVYDVTDRSSFDSLDQWLNEIKSELPSSDEFQRIIFVVCANKVDKPNRVVDSLEGKLWSDSQQFTYFETSALSNENVLNIFEALFDGIISTLTSGRKPVHIPAVNTKIGYNREQISAIQRLKNARDHYERLGLSPGATKDDINRAYRKLAVILHPDKNVAPGSDEAFKLLAAARNDLLKVSPQ